MSFVQTSRDTGEFIVQFSRVLLVLVTSGLVRTSHKSHNYVVRTCNKCHICGNTVFVHVARIRSVKNIRATSALFKQATIVKKVCYSHMSKSLQMYCSYWSLG